MSEQPVVVTPKPFWQSKTMLFNIALVALFVIDWLIGHNAMYGPLTPYAAFINEWLALIGGVVNLWLRLETYRPVAGSPGAETARTEGR